MAPAIAEYSIIAMTFRESPATIPGSASVSWMVRMTCGTVRSDVPEPAGTDGARDRRVFDHRDDVQGKPRDDPRERLRELDGSYDLRDARAGGDADVEARAGNLADRVLHEPREEWDACE